MELGIYLSDVGDYRNLSEEVKCKIEWVFFGNYGCTRKLKDKYQLLDFDNLLRAENKKLHYISPKMTQKSIESEKDKVLELLKHGVSVSINDWGLFYIIKDELNKDDKIYLGRLLTKSTAEKTKFPELMKREKEESAKYLMQNNFNHLLKINYFKQYGIKGIELSVNSEVEESYKNIAENGMEVIGFADDKILAVSRSCPTRRLNNNCCSPNCTQRLNVVSDKKEDDPAYIEMEMEGNVLFKKVDNDIKWSGYSKLIHTPSYYESITK